MSYGQSIRMSAQRREGEGQLKADIYRHGGGGVDQMFLIFYFWNTLLIYFQMINEKNK